MEITVETALPPECLQAHPDRGTLIPGTSMEPGSTAVRVTLPFRSAHIDKSVRLAMYRAAMVTQPLRMQFSCAVRDFEKPTPAGNPQMDVTCTCTLRGWPLLPAPLQDLHLGMQLRMPATGVLIRRSRSRPSSTISLQDSTVVTASFPQPGSEDAADCAVLPARGQLLFTVRLLVECLRGNCSPQEEEGAGRDTAPLYNEASLQEYLMTQPGALQATCTFVLRNSLLSTSKVWIREPLLGPCKVSFQGTQTTTPV